MKISVIVTVKNEEQSILGLLCGLVHQSLQPNEVIIVDALSSDKTVSLIRLFQQAHQRFPITLIEQSGNRSQGRNLAIKKARNEWIAITDAGCIPDHEWLDELAQQAQYSQADIIAGYYQAAPQNTLEAAIAPYMLVMPDKVNPQSFLPATRSMLMKKTVWEKVGGFDERLEVSEDYAFAQKVKAAGFLLSFTDKAIVRWRPTKTLSLFFQTVKNMACYDAKAGETRKKVWLVFIRYGIAVVIAIFNPLLFGMLALLYCSWAIYKNSQYLNTGWYWLPVLQIIADIGVMIGTVSCWLRL